MPFLLLDEEGRKQLKESGDVLTLGLELGLSVLFGIMGGRWLDEKFGTTWLQWLGFGLGLAAGARSLYRVARKAQHDLSDN